MKIIKIRKITMKLIAITLALLLAVSEICYCKTGSVYATVGNSYTTVVKPTSKITKVLSFEGDKIVICNKNKNKGLINTKGKTLLENKYKKIELLSNGHVLVYTSNNNCYLYDRNMKYKGFIGKTVNILSNGYFMANVSGNKWYLYDPNINYKGFVGKFAYYNEINNRTIVAYKQYNTSNTVIYTLENGFYKKTDIKPIIPNEPEIKEPADTAVSGYDGSKIFENKQILLFKNTDTGRDYYNKNGKKLFSISTQLLNEESYRGEVLLHTIGCKYIGIHYFDSHFDIYDYEKGVLVNSINMNIIPNVDGLIKRVYTYDDIEAIRFENSYFDSGIIDIRNTAYTDIYGNKFINAENFNYLKDGYFVYSSNNKIGIGLINGFAAKKLNNYVKNIKTPVQNPGKAKIKKVSSKKKSSKKLKLVVKKQKNVKGYQVKIYSTKKAAKKNKKVLKTKTSRNTSITISSKKLKNRKHLYIKVRAYRVDNKYKLYGSYSTIKSVKIK